MDGGDVGEGEVRRKIGPIGRGDMGTHKSCNEGGSEASERVESRESASCDEPVPLGPRSKYSLDCCHIFLSKIHSLLYFTFQGPAQENVQAINV